MILPTKRISEERCLLGIGANILDLLENPKTVSRLWNDFKKQRKSHQIPIVTYDWFVMALDLLFILNTIDVEKGVLQRSVK